MMRLKKILIVSAASVAVMGNIPVYAGGTEVVSPACPAYISPFVPFLYIGASAGWAYSDWNSFIISGFPESADTNGFAYGGKIGYQFLDNFGVEGGAYVLPNSKQTLEEVDIDDNDQFIDTDVSGTVKSWVAYGAATIRAALPFNPFLHVMGKVGGVYRAVNHSGTLYENVRSGSYGTVVFGANLEYDLASVNLPLTLGVDYLYVPGSNDSWLTVKDPGINKNAAPAAQIVVGTLAIHFAV
jgi:Outer membrane protein beta-barrel domain